MENNGLSRIHKNAFLQCKLRELYLEHNNISFDDEDTENLSPFRNCKDIVLMNLSFNNISKIYRDWKEYKNIFKLNLQHNSIKYIKVMPDFHCKLINFLQYYYQRS